MIFREFLSSQLFQIWYSVRQCVLFLLGQAILHKFHPECRPGKRIESLNRTGKFDIIV